MSNKTASTSRTATFARVPEGIPAGGQFAATVHGEPEVSLQSRGLEDFGNTEAIVKQAKASAYYWTQRMNQGGKSNSVDVDDVAQETLLITLKAIQDGKSIENLTGMLNRVARNITSRSTETVFRAEDRVAYRQFVEKCNALMSRENRSLTVAEERVLEQEVLDEWHDPRHKPSKEFRIARTTERSLDAAMMDSDVTLGSSLVSVEQQEAIPVDSYMDRAFNALDEKGVASKALARRLAWNAIAEAANVPLALEGSLSQRHATRYRGIMLKHDDQVMGACRDWDRGIDNEATEALFAPFGPDLTADQEEKVVVMLERLGDTKAQSMWESAVSFANNKHAETK